MSIIRTEHNKNNPYVILNKTALEDEKLSWAAKGLWSYLMSRPDNWNVSVAHLSSIYKDYGGGEKAIYSLLNELIENGYCQRKQDRSEGGKFNSFEYIISEFKIISPQLHSRDAVPPRADPPDAVNRHINNNDYITSNELNKKRQQQAASPDADVFSSSKKENDLKRAAIQLSELQLSPDVIEFAMSYSVKEIQNALECLKNRIGSIDNPSGYFRSALEKKFNPSKKNQPPEDLKASSKALALKIINSIAKNPYNVQIEVLNEYIEIITPGNDLSCCITIKYDEKGFAQQLENALRKKGCVFKTAKN